MEEIFKDVPGYEGRYQASNFGNVKSLNYNLKNKSKLLKPGINSGGYYSVVFHCNNVKKTWGVHQLVAMAFLNHKPCGNKLVVNHIDHNKLNNHVSNLEIVTFRYNTGYRKFPGSSKYPGISWYKPYKKYKAQAWANGKSIHIGYFDTEEDANEAYQKAIKEILK